MKKGNPVGSLVENYNDGKEDSSKETQEGCLSAGINKFSKPIGLGELAPA